MSETAIAAEQTGSETPLKRDANAHALGCAQKRILLRDELAAAFAQVERVGLAERAAGSG